jgi:hypothetical protein
MIKVNKPESLDGAKLKAELLAVGIDLGLDTNNEPNKPMIDGNGDLWLPVAESDLDLVNEILSNHQA